MKRILRLTAAAVILSLVSCSQYRYETVAGDPLKTKIYTLDNGLKVYMSVNKDTPRIQANIAVKVGSKNDPAQTTGLAHYFEHLMFKGTKTFGTTDYDAEKVLLDQIETLFEIYRSTTDEAERTELYRQIDSISYIASGYFIPNEYDKLMSLLGSEGTNAFTSSDMTVYVEDIPANQFENWARIQADRFMNPVIRGFHTELETVYEEKNMSLTQDFPKAHEELNALLFPDHPYGTQTVLGTQEHLKNPSITNIKEYHKTYYVPNNMAICLSGDFDPDKVVDIIEKYFGQMVPNENLPDLQFKTESKIIAPIKKDVYGYDAEMTIIGWKYPGAKEKDALVADVVSNILYNGSAGLIDLNLNQKQAILGGLGMSYARPDAGELIVIGNPKEGQSLEQVRDLLLDEVAKLRNGEFSDEVIAGTVNNLKLEQMGELESNSARSDMFVDCFINGTDWADEAGKLKELSKISKQDVVEWAKKYLGKDNYAVIYKRQGEDKNLQKVSAPQITPINANRDAQSAFLAEIKESEVSPIEPVFVDYEKDITRFNAEGLDVLYVYNDLNEIASLEYMFKTGVESDPALNLAFNYLSYLGTPTRSAEEIAQQMYQIACSFNLKAGSTETSISFNGLSENIGKAMEIIEDLIYNAEPDEEILENLKADILKSRADNKLNQGRCFNALQKYVMLGPEFIKKTTLPNDVLTNITSEELLTKVRNLMEHRHEVLYFGPESVEELKKTLKTHHRVAAELKPLEISRPKYLKTPKNEVFMVQYDAQQIYYLQFSNRGETLDLNADAGITLYNEYFGSGMNSIVFQELREARALAYSANAVLIDPSFKEDSYMYYAFIATQNDKMKTAIEAFDEIINDMPESEAAFEVAKEAIITRLRTERTLRYDILSSYLNDRELGVTEPRDKAIFDVVYDMTLEDVKAIQKKWVEDRHYNYAILGDIKDLDTKYLKTLGPVHILTLEEIFGY